MEGEILAEKKDGGEDRRMKGEGRKGYFGI